MQLVKVDKFKNEEKKLKKHYEELFIYEKIENFIRLCDSSKKLIDSSFAKSLKIERLKYQLNNYCSFNLCKNGGVIRLICSIDLEKNIVKFEFISMDHYKDFNNKIKGGR